MRSSTLEQWQGSRNNYLSIFSYVAINFNHSSAYHSLLPNFSPSKTELSQSDRRRIRSVDGGIRVGMVIKRLQLLRAKCFPGERHQRFAILPLAWRDLRAGWWHICCQVGCWEIKRHNRRIDEWSIVLSNCFGVVCTLQKTNMECDVIVPPTAFDSAL